MDRAVFASGWMMVAAAVSVGCPGPKPAAPADAGEVAAASQPSSASSLPSDHSTSSTAVALESLFVMPEVGPVVAKVNAFEITKEDLEAALRQKQVEIGALGPPQGLSRYDVLDGVVDELIDRKLEEVLAEQLGAKADPAAEAAFLEDLEIRMKQNPAFAAILLRAGKDEAQRKKDAHEAVLRKAIVEKLREGIAKELEAAAKTHYEEHIRDYKIRGGVQTWRIVVKAPRGMVQRDRDAARARAEDLHKKATKDPDNFENLARSHSEGGKSNVGGYIGFVARGTYNENMEKAIYAGKPGQVLPLYEDAQVFQIIKTGQRREDSVVPFEEAKEQIISQIFGTLMRNKVKARLAELREKQKIEIMIPELSALEAKRKKDG